MLLYTALLSLHSAHALSCLDTPDAAYPPNGQGGIPLDAVLRVTLVGEDYPLILQDDAGQELPFQMRRVENPSILDMLYLTPDERLQPNTTYTLSLGETEAYGEGWAISTFTTGSDTAAPPQTPHLLDVTRDRGTDEWGPWDWLELNVSLDDSSLHPGTFLLEISDNDRFTDAERVEVSGWEELGAWQVMAGSGPCGGSIELERGERHVRVALVGPDGTPSDFSEGIPAWGCSAAPAAAPAALPALLAFLLGAVGRLRRRR